MAWEPKDPEATLDYEVDWTAWLDDVDDTIESSSFTVPGDLVKESESVVSGNKKARVWISGGTPGQRYSVENTITTADGRTNRRICTLKVEDRVLD